MGNLYKPLVDIISIANLQTQQTGNNQVMQAAQTTKAADEFAVNRRQDLHARLDDRAKRFVAGSKFPVTTRFSSKI